MQALLFCVAVAVAATRYQLDARRVKVGVLR